MEDEDRKALAAFEDVVEERRDPETKTRLAAALGVVKQAFVDRDRWAVRIKSLELRAHNAIAMLDGRVPKLFPHGGIEARCTRCGGANVSCYAWINPNTSEIGEYAYDDNDYAAQQGASWCDDCEDHVVLRWSND